MLIYTERIGAIVLELAEVFLTAMCAVLQSGTYVQLDHFGRDLIKESKMPIERETIVTDSGAASGSGVLVGVLAVVIILLLIGGFTVFNGGFSMGGHAVTVDVPKDTVTK